MEKKQMFIDYIEANIQSFPPEIADFWESFKSGKSVGGFTENGQKILTYMIENENSYGNSFKAKDIGEGLFMSSRSVSGAMRKLITDGYVEKTPGNPVLYNLTTEGMEVTF